MIASAADELIPLIALQISARPDQVEAAIAHLDGNLDGLSADFDRHELDVGQLRWIEDCLLQQRKQMAKRSADLERDKGQTEPARRTEQDQGEPRTQDIPCAPCRPSNGGGWRVKRRRAIRRSSEPQEISDQTARRRLSKTEHSRESPIDELVTLPHYRRPNPRVPRSRVFAPRRLADTHFTSSINDTSKERRTPLTRVLLLTVGVVAVLTVGWSGQTGDGRIVDEQRTLITDQAISETAVADAGAFSTPSIRSGDQQLQAQLLESPQRGEIVGAITALERLAKQSRMAAAEHSQQSIN